MPHRYIILNKPFQVLCQFSQGKDAAANMKKQTLADFVSVPRVYPVGRLDYDSEGLLLLTDDGAWQQRLTNPRFEHPKTYWVQVEGDARDGQLDQLRRGLRIQDYKTRPAEAKVIHQPEMLWSRETPIRYRKEIPTSWLEVTLREGRNRQVRRMTAAVGLPTLRLIRVAMGGLWLSKTLAPGQSRDLTEDELGQLQASSDTRRSLSDSASIRSDRS